MIQPERAEKVRQFLQTYCIQSKHPFDNLPLKILPWQWNDIILPLYGTINEDGTRQYKRAGIWVPKKNGKTSLLAGLALFATLEQPGSEAYVIASDISQASILFSQAADYVELFKAKHPKHQFSKRLTVRRNIKTIEDKTKHSVLRVLSSTPEGKSGFSANFIAYDELAEWNACHAREIWDRLFNASIARVNSLQLVISTSQYVREHIGFEQFTLAQKIKANPSLDPTFLPVVYSLPEDSDWKLEENWKAVNPSIGHTIPLQSFHDDYKNVQNNPIEEYRFCTFRLCQWKGASSQWISSSTWQACGEHFQESDFHGQSVVVGADAARVHDLFAWCLIAQKNGLTYLMPRAIIPAEAAQRKEKFDRVPYTRWANMPNTNLFLSPGDTIDPSFFITKLLEDSKKFKIKEIRYDPNCGFELIRQQLEFTHGFSLVEVPPTYRWMSPATSEFERRAIAGKLRHPCNPIMDWCLANCAVRQNNRDEILIEKSRQSQRVDIITAAIIALSGQLDIEPVKTFDRNSVIFV